MLLFTNEVSASPAMTNDAFTRVGSMEESDIKIVSAADVAAGTYSIEDVILPLPGNAIHLPTNDTAAYYSSLLVADGISLDYFGSKACPVQFRMKGTYRRIMQSAHRLTWKISMYSNMDDEINVTELRALDHTLPLSKKRQREVNAAEASSTDAVSTATASAHIDGNAPKVLKTEEASTAVAALPIIAPTPAVTATTIADHTTDTATTTATSTRTALSINFSLPPGTYATMLLRELTKQSMETGVHSGMTATAIAAKNAATATTDAATTTAAANSTKA